MKSVDTNVLVRWITRDDPSQVPAADAVLSSPVFVPLTVFLELAWVLSSKKYRMGRAELAHVLTRMLDVETVTVPGEAGVRWAVKRFAAGADLADMLHIISSTQASAFVSFEDELDQKAGPDSPVPVEKP